MTKEEAKDIFLNRGYVKVNGGEVFNGDKWRQSVVVISEWLKEQEPLTEVLNKIRAEIDEHRKTIRNMADIDDWYAGKLHGHDCDIEIIDKYRVESEVKDE